MTSVKDRLEPICNQKSFLLQNSYPVHFTPPHPTLFENQTMAKQKHEFVIKKAFYFKNQLLLFKKLIYI